MKLCFESAFHYAWSYSVTIITSLWNILDPLLWLVTTLLLNSQISHSQATSCKHGHLELHRNWRLCPLLVFFRRCQTRNSSQDLLVISLEFLDSPENWSFIWFVLSFAISCWENLDTGSIGWNRYLDHNVVSIVCSLKYRPDLDGKFNTAVIRVFLDDWCDLEWQIDVLTDPVRHHFEKTIWWDKSDGSISVKSSKSNTLMKLDIINLNTLLLLLSILSWSARWLP